MTSENDLSEESPAVDNGDDAVVDPAKALEAELRKVIWPNRKQMGTYTAVVLVFLAFMVTLIGLVDLGVARLVMMVFGG